MANMNNPAGTEVCVPQETYLYNVRLAQAYVPFQLLCDTFTPLTSLMKGTAFPPLYSPWERRGGGIKYDDE